MSSVQNTLYSSIIFANNMKHIHLHAVGNKFDDIHVIAEEYYERASKENDFFAELALEFNTDVSNFTYASNYSGFKIEEKNAYNWENAIQAFYKNIEAYIEMLLSFRAETYIPNDVKSEIDSIVRYWKKENYYKNRNRMKEI